MLTFEHFMRVIEILLIFFTMSLILLGIRDIIQNRPRLSINEISSELKEPKKKDAEGHELHNQMREWVIEVANVGNSSAVNYNLSWFVIADNKLLAFGPHLLETQETLKNVEKFEKEKGCKTSLPYHNVPFNENFRVCMERYDGIILSGATDITTFQTSEGQFQQLLNAKDKSERSGLFLTITYKWLHQFARGIYHFKHVHLPYRDQGTNEIKTKDLTLEMN